MVSMRLAVTLIAVLLTAAAAALVLVFQDNITQFNLRPRTPFQIAAPPPPPAYGARGAWALWPDAPDEGSADIFYVHSTTYSDRRGWNGPITGDHAERVLREVAAANEAGPFLRVGAVYGPRYRQATLYASFTHKYDGLASRELAYRDVAAAFEHFLSQRGESERPIIMVGYGQGGLHVLGLLQSYFAADKDLRAYLAAAYVVDQGTPLSLFEGPLLDIPPCESPESVRCVISYIDIQPGFEDEERRFISRALKWNASSELVPLPASPLLCVNPLSWTATNERISAEHHLGAASATGLRLSETPPPIAKATSAQCVGSILSVDAPQQKFLRRKHWFGAQWRPQNFNLFYHDLTVDAARRIEHLNLVLEEEAIHLDPIEEAVDLVVSPVNKVPD